MRSPLPLSPASPVSPVLWYAVLGSPIAWSLQFGFGYWIAEAQCSRTGSQWQIPLSTWAVLTGIAAVAVSLGALATAIALFRQTSGVEVEGPPPDGRIRFLAAIGIAVAPLFIAIIAMTSAGVLILQPCTQS
jgi:hypothetical protein